MSVTAVILSYKRMPNVPKIIRGLREGSVAPDEIIVANNNPQVTGFDDVMGVTIVNSSKNFGCNFGHAVGLMADTTHFLYQDDDLKVQSGTLGNLIQWSEKYPEAILGILGVRINKGSEAPYTKGQRFSGHLLNEPVQVDVVVSRLEFCKTEKLSGAFELQRMIPEFNRKGYVFTEGDDILLSLANRRKGYQNYIIPTAQDQDITDLPDMGVSMCSRPEHNSQRNKAVREIMEIGSW